MKLLHPRHICQAICDTGFYIYMALSVMLYDALTYCDYREDTICHSVETIAKTICIAIFNEIANK